MPARRPGDGKGTEWRLCGCNDLSCNLSAGFDHEKQKKKFLIFPRFSAFRDQQAEVETPDGLARDTR